MGIKPETMPTKSDLIKDGVQPAFFKGYYSNIGALERKSNSAQKDRKVKKLTSAASFVMPEKADIEKYKTRAALRKMRKMPTLIMPA